jgi:Rrf2 family transcriptional regulator, iron-sulfur cluster assembly transcription factor
VAFSGEIQMRLSTKGRFAVTAMLDVALRQKNGPVALSDISARHQISLSYLEQMFSKLRASGLVKSTRGPGGGYALGHSAEDITVADIIGTVEGHENDLDAAVARVGADRDATRGVADQGVGDITQQLWNSFNARMEDYMQSVTLRSLVLEQLAKGFKSDAPVASQRGVFKKTKPQSFAPRVSVPNSVFALGNSLMAKA